MKNFFSCMLAAIILCSLTGCNAEVATVNSNSANPAPEVSTVNSNSANPAPEAAAKSMKDLDLHKPNECMLFMEAVLSEIEAEHRFDPGDILEYTLSYGVEKLENNMFAITVYDMPGTQRYIIVDANTNEYRYFDASIDYELLGCDEVKARFFCRSGQTALRYPNFPYEDTYNFAEKQWTKVHIPINRKHFYHKLGGHPYSFGTLDRIDVTDAKATIVFNFAELFKDPSIGSGLPVLYYWYDPIANQATLSFSGIEFSNPEIVKQLERLPGLTNA